MSDSADSKPRPRTQFLHPGIARGVSYLARHNTYIDNRISEITKTTLAHPNGRSATVLSTLPPSNANNADLNGPPATTTAFLTLPLKASHTKKARRQDPASTSRHPTLDLRRNQMEISGAQKTNRITVATNPSLLRLVVGGDTQPTLMMLPCPVPRSGERRRRKRRIGGRGQKTRTLFRKNRTNPRNRRRRRRKGASRPAATAFTREIPRMTSLRMLKGGYMVMVRKMLRKSPMRHDPVGQTRTLLAISFEDVFWVTVVCVVYFLATTESAFYEIGPHISLNYLTKYNWAIWMSILKFESCLPFLRPHVSCDGVCQSAGTYHRSHIQSGRARLAKVRAYVDLHSSTSSFNECFHLDEYSVELRHRTSNAHEPVQIAAEFWGGRSGAAFQIQRSGRYATSDNR